MDSHQAFIFFLIVPFAVTDIIMSNKNLCDTNQYIISLNTFMLCAGIIKMFELLIIFINDKFYNKYILAVSAIFIICCIGYDIFGLILFLKNLNCEVSTLVYAMFSICCNIFGTVWYLFIILFKSSHTFDKYELLL